METMKSQNGKQAIVWGGLMILLGGMLLIGTFIDLGAWVWVAGLAVAGFGVYGVYATDRSERWLLVVSYALLVIALMVALITLDILQGSFIATYVLSAIALPFLVAFLRGDRTRWGALIPVYILLAVGLMVSLIEVGVLDGSLVAAYVLLAVATPFLVVYARDTKQWWALIPGGITAIIGLSFLIATAAAKYIVPAVLIVVGAWVLVRQFTRKETTAPEVPAPGGPEVDQLPPDEG
jgi:hypothetical protein